MRGLVVRRKGVALYGGGYLTPVLSSSGAARGLWPRGDLTSPRAGSAPPNLPNLS